MKVTEIFEILDSLYNFEKQENYDNSGRQIFFGDENVSGILISLDYDFTVLSEALRKKCNVVVTHHPLLFTPVKCISFSDAKERLITETIFSKISVISVHTNLDRKYPFMLGEILGLNNQEVFLPDRTDPKEGFGSTGSLPEPVEFYDLLKTAVRKLEIDFLVYSGNVQKRVENITVINGSGAGFVKECAMAGADCLITSDVKYHNAKDAEIYGLCVIDIGHFHSEKMFKKIIKNDLHQYVKPEDCSILLSELESNPIRLHLER